MTKRVTFPSRTGAESSGELAVPSGSDKSPGLVLVQEYWGINDHVRSLADRFASEGFLVVAPDLYHGNVAKDANEAGRLMSQLDTLTAVNEIAGAAAFLKAHPRCGGKVGVVGFCLGGALSLAAACHVAGLSAIVPFYGLPPAEKVDYAKVTAPVLMHVASEDQWVTVPRAEEVKKAVTAHGGSFELHVYDAQHAFMNDTRPEVYSEENAKVAWERTIAFLQQHLA